jgi:Uncharacterized protein conserved in bacteria
MRIPEADGPQFAASENERYNRRKPRFAARLLPRRTPIAVAAAAGTIVTDLPESISETGQSDTSRRLISKRNLILLIISATALLCIAALIIVASKLLESGYTVGAVTRVNVIDRGENRIVFTHAKTAGEVLNLLGITPDSDDYINVLSDTPVTPDMTVEYHAVEYNNYTIDEILYHRTKTEEIQTIPLGETQVLQVGSDGSLYREVRQEFRDGELYDEMVLDEKYVAPVDELVRVGVGGTLVGSDGVTYNYSYYIDVSATAYQAKGITYTGKEATNGIVAVDPSVIPLGTKIYVKSDYADLGVCTADDIGGGIIGNKIDICMEGTVSELLQFGVRSMRVYILNP